MQILKTVYILNTKEKKTYILETDFNIFNLSKDYCLTYKK